MIFFSSPGTGSEIGQRLDAFPVPGNTHNPKGCVWAQYTPFEEAFRERGFPPET